jgi:hypothetical protein
MFSLSNLKNAAFVTKRFSFALRSLARSLAYVSCRLFPLALPLSRAATDCLFSLVLALAFSPVFAFPCAHSTSASALSLLFVLLLLLLSLFFGGGE